MCQNRIQPNATPVAEIMSQQLVTLALDDSIHEAVQMMAAHRLTALPVIDHRNQCVGMLAQSDLVEWWLSLDEDLENLSENPGASWSSTQTGRRLTVRSLMAHDVVTIGRERSLAEAAQLMSENQIHHLPVVDGAGQVIGLLSSLDLTRTLAAMGPRACCSKRQGA